MNSNAFVALMLIVLAVVLRMALVALGWPQTDSDEGTMGLMALHIAYHGEYPIFFYGQNYMGSLEAYLAAIVFHLIGPSLQALRLGSLLLFACFLGSMYLLARLLYTKRVALITLVILSLGSAEILFRQIETAGGYPELSLFGSMLLLCASWLALSSPRGQPLQKQSWKRLLAYGAFGYLVGLAIWSDLLVLPFAVMACLFLFIFCRDELRLSAVSLLLLGILIGIAPQVIYIATTPPGNTTVSVIGTGYHINNVSAGPVITPSFGLQIAGTVLVSLPLATGANPLCPLSPNIAWPLTQESSLHTLLCTAVHGAWGLGFIILWLVAASMAAISYWKLWLQTGRKTSGPYKKPSWKLWFHTPVPAQPPEAGQAAIRYAARLMILVSAGSTLLLYAFFQQSAVSPWPSARYLVGLLIAVPAVLFPLCEAPRGTKSFSIIRAGLRWGMLALIAVTFLLGSIATFEQVPSVQAHNRQQYQLIQDLQHIGATHIYTDYWTCDRIAFQSSEQIVCSVLDEQLQPGLNRYTPYLAIVNNDRHAAYVFPTGSPQAIAFASKEAALHDNYQRFAFDGYAVYMI